MASTYRTDTAAPAEPYPDDITAYRDGAGVTPSGETTAGQHPSTTSPTHAGPTTSEPLAGAGAGSTGHLVTEVVADISTLFRQEVALAKAEIREEARKAGKGAGMFAGAGGAGLFMLLFALLAIMFGLGEVMALGWAALIVTVVLGAVAAVLALSGRSTVRKVHPAPTQTVETLREDVQWAQNRRK